MRRLARLLGVALLLALGPSCGLADWLEPDVYFVKLSTAPAQTLDVVVRVAEALDLEPIHVFERATQGFSVRMPRWVAQEVERLPEVVYVQRDPLRPHLPERPPRLGDDEVPSSIARIGGPYTGRIPLGACHVAVLDSGIDASHPDLNVVGALDAVAASGGTPAPGADPNGHGTHVAGTIGARADGAGVVGVAPGVPLHAVRVLGASGWGYTTDIVAGLEYALRDPAICVVNLSLGSARDPRAPNDPMRDAIEALEASGVLVVVAAGNAGANTSGYSPAGYAAGLAVSAYDASGGRDNGFATFTNYGSAVVVAAPGVAVRSTWPGGGHAQLSGTSMAAPAVAGAAAVYRTLRPDASVSEVKAAIVGTAEHGFPGQTGPTGRHSEPMVDVAALVRAGGG